RRRRLGAGQGARGGGRDWGGGSARGRRRRGGRRGLRRRGWLRRRGRLRRRRRGGRHRQHTAGADDRGVRRVAGVDGLEAVGARGRGDVGIGRVIGVAAREGLRAEGLRVVAVVGGRDAERDLPRWRATGSADGHIEV